MRKHGAGESALSVGQVKGEGLYGSGSVARGLAVVAGLAFAGVAAGLLIDLGTAAGRTPEATCATPIEITTNRGTRLGCADEPAVTACGPLSAGARVTLPGCAKGGMSAAARLLVDLPLELNRATAEELELLEGIGPHKAAAIVAYREANGPYRSVAELQRVRGIGPATVERLAPQLRVTPPPP